MDLFYRPEPEPRPSRDQREEILLRKLARLGRTTDWAFTPGEYEGEVKCPFDGTELDVHFHGGASCPTCGHEYELGRDGTILPADLTIPEMASQWPDTLPWGEQEQQYYRTATSELAEDAKRAYQSLLSTGGFSLTRSLEAVDGNAYFTSYSEPSEVVPLEHFSPDKILQFRNMVLPHLQGDSSTVIGGWLDGGMVYLDLSRAFQSREEAIEFGLANGQKAIWDGFNGTEIRLDTPEWQEMRSARVRKLGAYVRFSAPIYSPRLAMAERTGDPQLDALIEQFMEQPYQGQWSDSWEGLADNDHFETEWGQPFSLDKFRHPGVSDGMCYVMADKLAQFLSQHGIKAYTSDQTSESGETSAEEFGLTPPEHYAPDEFVPHHWCIAETRSGTFGIDFTASQFGESEFPMVQKLNEGGQWQRKFAAKTSYPFLFEPNSGWIAWGQPNGHHDEIYTSLQQQGGTPAGYIFHGRYFPDSRFSDVKIYDPTYPMVRGGAKGESDRAMIVRNAPQSPPEAPGGDETDSWTPSLSPNEMDDWNPFTG